MSDEIRRLEAQLDVTTDVLQRVDILNALARALRESDPQRGLAFSQTAHELAESQSYQKGIATSLMRLGQLNFRLGNCGLALPQAIKALAMFEALGDGEMQAPALLTVGVIYDLLGNHSDALDYALNALNMCQDSGDRLFEARALNNIGAIYNRMGDYVHELRVYDQALQIHQETGQEEQQAVVLNNMAMAYYSLQEWTNALDKGHQSLHMVQEKGLNVMLEAIVLCTLGDVHLDMGDYDQALGHFQQSIVLARQTGFKHVEMCALLSTGKVYVAQQQADLALPYLHQALEIVTESEAASEVIACQQVLAEACKQQGDLEAALDYYEQLYATKQALSNEEMAKKLTNLKVIHDTETAQKEAEIYRLRNVELEQEIARREGAEEQLRQYATELEARNAELDAFAHTVAHDLKSPLTALMVSNSLLRKFTDLPKEKRIKHLNSVAQAGRWMHNIIDALLLLASVREADKVVMSRLDMARLVAETQERMALLIEEHRAEIVLPETWPLATGYDPWVQEVWVNYLSNSIKYGGSPPRIELGGTLQADGLVCFWVRDNGPGLTPQQQGRLFIPFERLHDVSTKGHGLGLSIVRRIVEKLGGQVSVTSEVGQGSTFYFTLPAADASSDPA